MRAATALAGALLLAASPAYAWVRTTTCDAVCNDSCGTANDGVCDDTTTCIFGSDCTDCGYRAQGRVCVNSCISARDGVCDDEDGSCLIGTDCADCGPRVAGTQPRYACAANEVPIPIAWTVANVGYALNEAGYSQRSFEQIAGVVDTSFATWDDVDCSYLGLYYDGVTTETVAGYAPDACGDSVNMVRFAESGWNQLGYPSLALALTSVTFDPTNGHIADADIEMNAANFEFGVIGSISTSRNVHDLQNTLTHEIGHFVGLDHTYAAAHVGDGTFEDATMAATSPAGETSKRTLHADDIAGVCDAYPPGSEPPTPSSRGGGGCGHRHRGTDCGAALVLVPFLRRRRRA
ncbi:MAG: hypothetical protein H6698_04815 [Myxococcales bacterium]|nr:hypothetical protein [Myxococcales bacterium]MCB9533623.1 hypothetical protein [Myxococcales bacterium]